MRAAITLLWACALAACSTGAPAPARLDTNNDACASCRMAISNRKLAAQIVAAGEEPRFFDDIGCLAAYLRDHSSAGDAAVFVTDHATGNWIPIDQAVYSRVPELDTPMGSHLVAHASTHAREADAAARGAVAVSRADVFGRTR